MTNESIEILRRMLSKAENLPETDPNRDAVKKALTDAITALEEKDRSAEKPSGDGLDLSADPATDHLLRLASGETGRTRTKANRDREAALQLAALVDNATRGGDQDGPAAQLARLVKD